MKSTKKLLWAFSLLMPLVIISATGNVFGGDPDDYTDDYVPDVTARVARITYISGDAQIRRADNREWETVVKNLPVVEGDEIATSGNALLEIQLNKDSYLRISQNSYIKFLNLKDEGVAISLSEGILSARLFEFDKDKQYFEIDAPGTTVAVRKAGLYRIDAQDARSREKAVRITVQEDGEARIYSQSSGFTLRDGRSAKVFLEGDYAGEWDMADASKFYDEFDEWIAKSDAAIIKRLRDAYYDKYYDADIYGAEDLNAYGEWVYTRKYGYVWRPYRTAIDDYANWSPYRYGHWRWIPPFGWTWVNDEPWGWATYHHGRWVYIDNYWVWSPYGAVRGGRSWWRSALIILGRWGNDVYWCPLPYDYAYYDYNRHYHRRHRRDRDNQNGNGSGNGNGNPTPTPTPAPFEIIRGGRNLQPPFVDIPPTGIITVAQSEFGRGKNKFVTPPLATGKEILAKIPETVETPPILPDMKDLNGKISKEILIEKPRIVKSEPTVKIGASERKIDAPMDKELEQKRIFGNRVPIQRKTDTEQTKSDPNDGTKGGMTGFPNEPTRRTGAVNRPVFKQDNDGGNTQTETTKTERNDDPQKQKSEETPPIFSPPVERKERSQPRIEQPRREEPKYEPPTRKETPRYDPPPTRSEPKYEPPPRNDPPPPKNDPPPSKSEPEKPSPIESKSSKKDG